MAGYGQVLISRVYGQGHLDRTSLVNKLDLLYGFRGNFSCGIQREANHSAVLHGSWPSCPDYKCVVNYWGAFCTRRETGFKSTRFLQHFFKASLNNFILKLKNEWIRHRIC